MSEENKINFGAIEVNKDNEIKNFSDNENQNLISKINQEEATDNKNIINLDNIRIQEVENINRSKIDFKETSINNTEKKHYQINYRKIFIISFITIIFTLSISIGLDFYNNYINNYSLSIQDNESNLISNINKIKNLINNYLGFSLKNLAGNNYNIIGANGVNNLNEIINSNINYIQKKDILNAAVKKLSNTILDNHLKLENIKKSITKEGFFSKEIGDIISEEEQISSIYNSLLSLEAIKFNSAINVFPYLDTFLEGLSNSTNITKKDIEEKNKEIISRGEKDINLYLKNCYLNPFEIDYQCNIIGDFEKYYILTDDINFETEFFKKLIKYTDTKLEQTELPSFSMDFKRFDKNSNQITFSIDINTFRQDEIELAKKGILSPHIFILNNLINNLRQSRFILGEGIVIKTLKIEPKTINIGSTEFNINNSHKLFTVDIQKESAREIEDFVDIKN